MKNSCLFLVFLFSIAGNAQDWQTNFDSALAEALAENKPLLLVFSGSDWCAPCIKLDRSIWQSEEFQTHSEKNYVLYKADFPRKKKNQLDKSISIQNNALAERYNPKGYLPLVLILNENGEVLGKTGFQNIPPSAYIDLLDSFDK
ncbi:MAG: thioredoxin family protein [Croceivirga sp.]